MADEGLADELFVAAVVDVVADVLFNEESS